LASTAASVKSVGVEGDNSTLKRISELVGAMEAAADGLEKVIGHEATGSVLKHAEFFRDKVIPAMNAVRDVADAMESIISDDLWPLPTYQEMLFIK